MAPCMGASGALNCQLIKVRRKAVYCSVLIHKQWNIYRMAGNFGRKNIWWIALIMAFGGFLLWRLGVSLTIIIFLV